MVIRWIRVLYVAALVAAFALTPASFAKATPAQRPALPSRMSASAPGAAALDVSATQLEAGQTLTITGTNFNPDETVSIYWNGAPIATTTGLTTTVADASGSFIAAFTVPASVGGSATVAAVGQQSGLLASASVQVQGPPPTATLTPGDTPPGSPTPTSSVGPQGPCSGPYSISGSISGFPVPVAGQVQLQDFGGTLMGSVALTAPLSVSGIVTGTVDSSGKLTTTMTFNGLPTITLTGSTDPTTCSSATVSGTVFGQMTGTFTLTRINGAATPTPTTSVTPTGICSGSFTASGSSYFGPITGTAQLQNDNGTLTGSLATILPLSSMTGTLSGTIDASGNVSVTLLYVGLSIPLTGTATADCSVISLADNSGAILGNQTTLTLTNTASTTPTATPATTSTAPSDTPTDTATPSNTSTTPTETPTTTSTPGPTLLCNGTYDISGAPIPISGQAQLAEDGNGNVTGPLTITSPLAITGSVTATIDNNDNVFATLGILSKSVPLTGTVTPDCSLASLSGFIAILGSSVTITLTQTGSPTPTATATVSAGGTSTATIPGAPSNVTATAGDGMATVSWTAPDSDGGSPVTDYKVYVSDGTIVDTGSTATSAQIPELTDGTPYTFTVTALNDVGEGTQSDPSNVVTPTVASPTPTGTETSTATPTTTSQATGPNCTGTYTVGGLVLGLPVTGTAQLQDTDGAITGNLSITAPIPASGPVTGTVSSDGIVNATLTLPIIGTVVLSGQAVPDCSSATLNGAVLGNNATFQLTQVGGPTGTPTDTATPTDTSTAPTDTSTAPADTSTAPAGTPTDTATPTTTSQATGPNCTGTYDVMGMAAGLNVLGQAQLQDTDGVLSGNLTITQPFAVPSIPVNGTVAGDGTATTTLTLPVVGTLALTGTVTTDCSSATLQGVALGVPASFTLTRTSGAPTATATNTVIGGGVQPATPTSTATDTATATATSTPTNTSTPTATSTATNTPTSTATSTATHTQTPPGVTATVGTSAATASPTSKPATATTTATAVTCSPRQSRLAVKIVRLPRTVAAGTTLAVHVHTAAHARATIVLEITSTKTTVTGKGKHQKRVTKTIVVYRATAQTVADAHGDATGRIAITYKATKALPGLVTVTARLGCQTGTAKGKLTVVPRPSGHKANAVVGPKTYYLALGDSLAYGFQPNGDHSHGYVPAFYKYLHARGARAFVNLGCPHETITTLVKGGCTNARARSRYGAYKSQLAAALAFIRKHPGQVSPVTIDIGAEDFLRQFDVKTCTAPSIDAAATLIDQYTQVLKQLRAALHGKGDVVTMNYYFPYENRCPQILSDVALFNGLIEGAAHRNGALVADVFRAFHSSKTPNRALCTYTWICGHPADVDATTRGYAAIATALEAAVRYPSRSARSTGQGLLSARIASVTVPAGPPQTACTQTIQLAVVVTYGGRTSWSPGSVLLYQAPRGVRVLNGSRGGRFALPRPSHGQTTVIVKLAQSAGVVGGNLVVMAGSRTLGRAALQLAIHSRCRTAVQATRTATPTLAAASTMTPTSSPTTPAVQPTSTANTAPSPTTGTGGAAAPATATATTTPTPSPTATVTATPTPALPNCTGTYNVTGPGLVIGGQTTTNVTGQATLQDTNGTVTGSLNISAPLPATGTVNGTVAADGTAKATLVLTFSSLPSITVPLTGSTNAACSSGTLTGNLPAPFNEKITFTLNKAS